MSDTKTDTPPGYPEGWQPEEIRTIEPQPLPVEQQPPKPLDEDQQEEFDQLQVLYPHDAVIVEYDEDNEPSIVTPDGKTLKQKQAEVKAEAKAETEAKPEPKAETKSESKASTTKK